MIKARELIHKWHEVMKNSELELLDEEISVVPLPWTPSKKTN